MILSQDFTMNERILFLRLKAIRELMGFIQDGSNDTVSIYQDDATGTYFIKTSHQKWFSDSFDYLLDIVVDDLNLDER